MDKHLHRSVWALAGVSLAALLATRELSLPTVLVTATLFPAFIFFEARKRLHRVPWFENSLVLIFFTGSVLRLIWNKEPFVGVMADFLIAFMLLKCAFQKTRRDWIQMIALSFFILLSASTLALDFTYLLGFLVYVVIAARTLCLLTVTGSDASTYLPSSDSAAILRQAARIAFLTVVTVVALGTAVFMAFPRLSFTVFRGEFLRPVRQTGFSDSVSLRESGRIFRDPRVVMRVEIPPEENDGRWNGKLRGITLNYFDGWRWMARGPNDPAPPRKQLRGKTLLETDFKLFHVDKETFVRRLKMRMDRRSYLTQTIYLEPSETSVLFAAPWAQSLRATVPEILIGPGFSLARPSSFRGRVSYQVRSLVEQPSYVFSLGPDESERFGPALSAAGMRFLQLPASLRNQKDPLTHRTRALLNDISPTTGPVAVKADKIADYLRENYRYSLNTRNSETSDPIQDFLFSTKEGHCEHFASALAILLRMEGIPARLVSGFMATEWNGGGGYYVVRGRDAHSWVEAWVNGAWREYDPTPAISLDRQTASSWKRIREKVDQLNFLWNDRVLGYDLDAQQRATLSVARQSHSLDRKISTFFHTSQKPELKSGQTFIKTILPFLAVGLLGTLLWKTHRKTPWRGIRDRQENPAVAIYRAALKNLAKQGMERKPQETPWEFKQRVVGRVQAPITDDLGFLTQSFCEARFGNRIFTLDEITSLHQAAERIRQRRRNGSRSYRASGSNREGVWQGAHESEGLPLRSR